MDRWDIQLARPQTDPMPAGRFGEHGACSDLTTSNGPSGTRYGGRARAARRLWSPTMTKTSSRGVSGGGGGVTVSIDV